MKVCPHTSVIQRNSAGLLPCGLIQGFLTKETLCQGLMCPAVQVQYIVPSTPAVTHTEPTEGELCPSALT